MHRMPLLIAAAATTALLAGCGSSGSKTAAATTTTAAASAGPTSTVAGAKVNANTASRAEIAKAFAAAGIPNADRWAKEVVQYRPYTAADTNFSKLRANLAKFNPGEPLVDKMVSVLTP